MNTDRCCTSGSRFPADISSSLLRSALRLLESSLALTRSFLFTILYISSLASKCSHFMEEVCNSDSSLVSSYFEFVVHSFDTIETVYIVQTEDSTH
jgi:hypothetical protein